MLKKELKDMKTEQRNQQIKGPLDMSQCRKITKQRQESRKSSSSPGYSSGEKRNNSGRPKKDSKKAVR